MPSLGAHWPEHWGGPPSCLELGGVWKERARVGGVGTVGNNEESVFFPGTVDLGVLHLPWVVPSCLKCGPEGLGCKLSYGGTTARLGRKRGAKVPPTCDAPIP